MSFDDISEATSFLKEKGQSASYVAGGTDIIVQMRSGKAKKGFLVDISSMPGLRGIIKGPGVSIGSLTTIEDMLRSPLVAGRFPALYEAAKLFAAWQVRNLATLGGNLCNASPAADMAPPLLIYDAIVVASSGDEKRKIPVAEFFVGPGSTSLTRGEMVTEVLLPSPSGGSAFVKLGKRQASILAVVSAAARIVLDAGKVKDVRLALGSVAPTPMRAMRAEHLLKDRKLDFELLKRASEVVKEEVRPIGDVRAGAEYRREMAAVLSARALMLAATRAGGVF